MAKIIAFNEEARRGLERGLNILEAGFAAAHRRGGPVVAVGTDCLELDSCLVDEAFALLAVRDAVFGPAADGGYYLVGTACHLAGFFDGIRLSTPHALSDHRARCGDRAWSVGMQPASLADVTA